MNRRLYLGIVLALLIAACSPQGAAPSEFVGTGGPDFTLEDALGGQTSLSDFEGQPVLLYFHMAVG